ncbi:MAG: hypothetical protein N4A39_11905 [Roseicyclus sp.]|jgi:hypothetical protein|nr:hypothetical protein [Roseicyclus sp.]
MTTSSNVPPTSPTKIGVHDRKAAMATELRIRRDVEAAIGAILDRQVQGTTHAQTLDYVARLRTVVEALRAEAAEIEALADAEERDLPPPRVKRLVGPM